MNGQSPSLFLCSFSENRLAPHSLSPEYAVADSSLARTLALHAQANMSALDLSRSKRRPRASKPSRSETAKRACSKPRGRSRRERSHTSAPTPKMPGTGQSRARRVTVRSGRANSTSVAEATAPPLRALVSPRWRGASEVEVHACRETGRRVFLLLIARSCALF